MNGPDADTRECLFESVDGRQRMASSRGGIGHGRREVQLRVEVGGAGDVTALVRRTRPHVDQHVAHGRAPRGATSSSTTRCSGNGLPSVGHAGFRIGDPCDDRRPGARKGRTEAPGRQALRGRRRAPRTGGTARAASRRARPRRASRRRSPLPLRAGPRAPRSRPPRRAGRSPASAPRDAFVDVPSCGMMATAVRGRRLCDPRDLPVPGEREAAEERCTEIVGVRLERQSGRQ